MVNLGEHEMLPNPELILITLGLEFAFKSNGINACVTIMTPVTLVCITKSNSSGSTDVAKSS